MSLHLRNPSPPHLAPSSDQVAAFRASGHLHLPGLLADEVEDLDRAFEDLTRAEEWQVVHCSLFDATRTGHQEAPRLMVAGLLDRTPFARLGRHPALVELAAALGGDDAAPISSNASVYRCDTLWHDDAIFTGGRGGHVMLMAYLDPLDGASGALRVLPGTHRPGPLREAVGRDLRRRPELRRRPDGPCPDEVAAEVLPTAPGDVIALDLDVVHATFGGGDRRRLLSLVHGPPDSPMCGAEGDAGGAPRVAAPLRPSARCAPRWARRRHRRPGRRPRPSPPPPPG